ncbi:MAG: TIGR04086 family membrane protein [Clostridia bacterium]|nr:TIGR04086 family membrane protein [Clostridia bacterium]
MSDIISVSSGSGTGIFRVMLKGVKFSIISYVISFVLLLILAALIVYTNTPESICTPGVDAILLIGAFISAFLTARCLNSKGLLCGFFVGAFNIILLFGMGVLFTTAPFLTASKALFVLYGGIAGALGGIIGVNTGKN